MKIFVYPVSYHNEGGIVVCKKGDGTNKYGFNKISAEVRVEIENTKKDEKSLTFKDSRALETYLQSVMNEAVKTFVSQKLKRCIDQSGAATVKETKDAVGKRKILVKEE